VGEPREDKDNGHIPSAVTGCLQFGEDATSMTRRLGAEAPKKKLVYQKKKLTHYSHFFLFIEQPFSFWDNERYFS
jgi:hypothetical protein